jgi:2-dehydro-3-deoxygluconokinase
VFGIVGKGSDVESGKLDKAGYASVAEELSRRFGCSKVAITLRTSLSASRNLWAGMLYAKGKAFFSNEYDLQIVDRVGGGDSFGGGLIYALATGKAPQAAIDFAVAASALKHTIEHDFNLVSVAEVETLAAGNGTGRVQR